MEAKRRAQCLRLGVALAKPFSSERSSRRRRQYETAFQPSLLTTEGTKAFNLQAKVGSLLRVSRLGGQPIDARIDAIYLN